MRLSLLLLLLTLVCTCGHAQDTLKVTSLIEQATVFLDGAQVQRKAETNLAQGRQTLIFTGLTTDMDPESVQVHAGGDDFMVLSVSQRLNFGSVAKNDPQTNALYDRLDEIDKRADIVSTRVQIARDEEDILKENRVVAGDAEGLKADELRATVAFQRERLTEIRLLYLELTDSLEVIDEERTLAQARIANIGKRKQTKTTAEIVVVTESKQATRSDFTLTYLVPNASWTPKYDVRVADISKPIDLRYRADVRQNTGEDWSNIKLKLSTGDPTASAIAPTLETWRLANGTRPPVYRPVAKAQRNFGYRTMYGTITDAESGDPMIGASLLLPGTNIGTVTDVHGTYQLDVPEEATQVFVSYAGFLDQRVQAMAGEVNIKLAPSREVLQEVVVTGYAGSSRNRKRSRDIDEDNLSMKLEGKASGMAAVPVNTTRKATTVNFDIDLPYTIPSDGKARLVEIKQHELPATYTHFAVPKYEPSAYLTAAITKWEQYDLLSGDINLFFEGTYLGVSHLDVENTSDTLELSLGKDPNVVVERTPIDEFRERNFLGSKVSQSRGYTLSVRNKKSQAITLTLKDQIPVSGDERIEVKSEIGNGGQLAEKTGIITWRTQVAPNTEWANDFNYTIKYSNGMRIVLE